MMLKGVRLPEGWPSRGTRVREYNGETYIIHPERTPHVLDGDKWTKVEAKKGNVIEFLKLENAA